MSDLPQILVYGALDEWLEPIIQPLSSHCRLLRVETVSEAVECLAREDIQGVCVLDKSISPTGFMLEARGLLQQIPDGLALLDSDARILWHNRQLSRLAGREGSHVGEPFFSVFPAAELLGPDFAPLHTALASGETARTLMHMGAMTYQELSATPLRGDNDEYPSHLLVTVRDVTEMTLERQKLDAIYRAGLELGDLQPQDVREMSVDDRIELLKSKILYFTQDVLEFETVEIRLVDPETNVLRPLLSHGMDPDAEDRELYASAEGNGVTGFVAATGSSYLCEDTCQDPLYLPGAPGARSSLTVPLILHEEILGTFNVESPRAGAFTQADLQFLELFSREVAIALNTLNLLQVEQAASITESSHELLRQVADPLDEILNEAAWLGEHIGDCRDGHHDDELDERLQRIQQHAREVRHQILQLADEMSPRLKQAGVHIDMEGAILRTKRLLFVDADRDIRRSAHELLGPFGCIVETARDGSDALRMARTFRYDLVVADIRLPDMSGSEFFRRFRALYPQLPIILMTEFGYDAGHSIVKARQMGMRRTLFKPFRRDLLVKTVSDELQDQATFESRGQDQAGP